MERVISKMAWGCLVLAVMVAGANADIISISTFDSDAEGWSIEVWKASPDKYGYGSILWDGTVGSLGGGMRAAGSGSTDNTDRCTREGASIYKVISTVGYYSITVSYDLRYTHFGGVFTGWGDGGCDVRNNDIQDQLNIYYSTDSGATWVLRATVWEADLDGYTSYGTRTLSLPGACNNRATFAIKFDWQVNQGLDLGDLDNIVVSGSPPDTTPPGNVTNLVATPGNHQVTLSWTNPSDADVEGTMIRCKTTGYPTNPTDGELVVDQAGGPLAEGSAVHTNLASNTTYYYTAFAHDGMPNYADGSTAQASATTLAPLALNVRPAYAAITIDGDPSDWNLPVLTTPARGGQNETGDYALIGYDNTSTCYYGSSAGGGFQIPPTDRADHTARVWSRYDATYQYFLARIDDSEIRTPNGVDFNWANDAIEFYIDPAHDRGTVSMITQGYTSTSDIQLVIDAANQKNVYMCTDAYKAQVLAGVTSAVVQNTYEGYAGWWVEVRIAKSVLDPDMPAKGVFGVDFNFRDNDGPASGSPDGGTLGNTSVYCWSDPSGQGFPSKIANNWGEANDSHGIPFDFDGDGHVDLVVDYAQFEACSTGPGIAGPPAGCGADDFGLADGDGDGDVDQADFSLFERCYSGPDIEADPNCAD